MLDPGPFLWYLFPPEKDKQSNLQQFFLVEKLFFVKFKFTTEMTKNMVYQLLLFFYCGKGYLEALIEAKKKTNKQTNKQNIIIVLYLNFFAKYNLREKS